MLIDNEVMSATQLTLSVSELWCDHSASWSSATDLVFRRKLSVEFFDKPSYQRIRIRKLISRRKISFTVSITYLLFGPNNVAVRHYKNNNFLQRLKTAIANIMA